MNALIQNIISTTKKQSVKTVWKYYRKLIHQNLFEFYRLCSFSKTNKRLPEQGQIEVKG